MKNKEPFKFKEGDKVQKRTGYKFPGVVVSTYRTLSDKPRYVVECIAEGAEGCQHIFNHDQLEIVEYTWKGRGNSIWSNE